MTRLKDATGQDVISWNEDSSHQNSRSLNDWEEENILNLLALLVDPELWAEVDDETIWPLEPDGAFSKGAYVIGLVMG